MRSALAARFDGFVSAMSPQPPQRCAVVIVNYRTAELTSNAVRSALVEIDRSQDRIVIVDNASGDGSLEAIRRCADDEGWGSAVEWVASPVNGGFSAGNNRGIESVEAAFYLLLNSDAVLSRGALAELLAALDDFPDVGIVGPRIRNPAGQDQVSTFRYRTPLGEALESIDLSVLRRAFPSHDPLMVIDPEGPHRNVEWLSFACVLVRREVFERIGSLDEDFFLYFEDLDFCRRSREAGFGILYWPRAVAVHDEGSSSAEPVALAARSRRPDYYYKARSRYFARYYGRVGLLAANLMRMLGAPAGWIRGGARREWLDIWTGSLGPARPRLAGTTGWAPHDRSGRSFVLLDRDGTLVHDRGYTHRIEDYALLPGVANGLKRLADAGFGLAIVTNQSGIGRGYYSETDFERFQGHLESDLRARGIVIEASFHCPHTPEAGCDCRKPGPGLIEQASSALGFECAGSWVIGDTASDIGAAQTAGCAGSVLVMTGEGEAASSQVAASVPRARNLEEAAGIILARSGIRD